MKIIAYYLPQFHTIPENDEWWGKGFTEWVNVKKGQQLYRGHYQPRIPLEGYYSLENKSTMLHQAELANEYGIYGMAFYHYWFEGKMLLQKPAENLLCWKDIPMNFMFFWANHSWIRSWDGVSTVLMKQSYGSQKDWKEHFDYMLSFFKDDRYIKISGKPAIGIYNASEIPDLDSMIQFWNDEARNNGFNGVYVLETEMGDGKTPAGEKTDAVILRAPNVATRSLLKIKLFARIKKWPQLQRALPSFYPCKYSYEKAEKELVKYTKSYTSSKSIMYGDFTGWDNTCRHNKRGSISIGSNPETFEKYLAELSHLAKKNNIEYLFLNAWNEWAEGMYLEPDNKYGFKYLEAVKHVLMD